jgi:four helix bundle protein
MENVEEMPVHQAFYSLALEIERQTRGFGPDFRWLRNQMLRSSESVCANMTEGFYSQYSTEYLQCLFRCRREARETMQHLKYAGDTNQLNRILISDLITRYNDALRQLSALVSSIERKIKAHGKAKSSSSY